MLCIPGPFGLSVHMMTFTITNIIVLTGVWKHRKSVSSVLLA